MRQHVNPLSKIYNHVEPIPPLKSIFSDINKPLHLDIGCGSGSFLMKLAKNNNNWNYIGLEIREKLVNKSNFKLKETLDNISLGNLPIESSIKYSAFPNAKNRLSIDSSFNLKFDLLTNFSLISKPI